MHADPADCHANQEKLKSPSNGGAEPTAANTIFHAMKALGLQTDLATDVATIQALLVSMNLDDFETSYAPMATFFDSITATPQELGPLLGNIAQALAEKHPAIIEFAQLALENNWLSQSDAITRSLHVAFILEAMTSAMCNSDTFFKEIFDHLRNKERELGIDSSHLIRTIWNHWPRTGSFSGSFFATAKAVSLDPAMIYFKLRRELGSAHISKAYIKGLYKKGDISYLEYKLLLPGCRDNACYCSDWLRINIYEAGITEYNNGFKANAFSAHVLSEDVKKHCRREGFKSGDVLPDGDLSGFYQSILNRNNQFPSFSFKQEWVSLYLSWNMAFILGELNNLHFLFPKLLIPSVLNAKPENFLGARIISLWLSINSALFLKLEGSERLEGPSNRQEMATAWGEINRSYAQKFTETQTAEYPDILEASFKQRFSRPFFNLAKLVFRFVF